MRKPIVRTGNFVGRVRVLEPMKPFDGRCRIIPFPKKATRDPSLWRVKTCQWIDIDPKGQSYRSDLHCGCPVQEGSSYCLDHHKRAYIKATPGRVYSRRVFADDKRYAGVIELPDPNDTGLRRAVTEPDRSWGHLEIRCLDEPDQPYAA